MQYLKNFKKIENVRRLYWPLCPRFFLVVNEMEDGDSVGKVLILLSSPALSLSPFFRKSPYYRKASFSSHVQKAGVYTLPPFPSLGPGESLYVSLHLSLLLVKLRR